MSYFTEKYRLDMRGRDYGENGNYQNKNKADGPETEDSYVYHAVFPFRRNSVQRHIFFHL